MKKLFQIILGISFLFLLVGCSSQETATFTQKSGKTDVTLVYTYDKKTDTVTKIKIETNEPAEHTEALRITKNSLKRLKELMEL